jgi:AcrR family transcriptional regulator
MTTKKRDIVVARVLESALGLLRREGATALTQPRIAKASGLRQSHITYYFPRRSDLVAAVAASVAERLKKGFETALAADRPGDIADRLARIVTPEQTRLLLALVLAADQEKAIRALFRHLTSDIRNEIAVGLARQGIEVSSDAVALFHALGVGLAVLDLARAEPAARRETRASTALALRSMAKQKGQKQKGRRA